GPHPFVRFVQARRLSVASRRRPASGNLRLRGGAERGTRIAGPGGGGEERRPPRPARVWRSGPDRPPAPGRAPRGAASPRGAAHGSGRYAPLHPAGGADAGAIDPLGRGVALTCPPRQPGPGVPLRASTYTYTSPGWERRSRDVGCPQPSVTGRR